MLENLKLISKYRDEFLYFCHFCTLVQYLYSHNIILWSVYFLREMLTENSAIEA